MIIALAGRRIDAPDTSTPAFPLQNVPIVGERLRGLMKEHDARAIVSSAACGADLLALQAAGELGLRRRILLPFNPQRFRDNSVTDRPGDWASVYDLIIEEVELRGDLVIADARAEGDQAYLALNISILDEAARLARQANDQLLAVVIWDGISRQSIDVTSAFADEARKRKLPVIEVSTR